MKLAIVGGALQGMESVYLAKRAGYETFVIDKRNNAPAFSLADEHSILDPVKLPNDAMAIFKECDAVLPACEDLKLLTKLDNMLKHTDIPLLFDLGSYIISSSKSASNSIMERIGVPIPKKWQDCGYPVIVKPSSQSGSVGVTVAYNEEDVARGVEEILKMGDEPVIQEFVSGKSVSMEVIGNGRKFRSFATTEIIVSENYDCKRVKCSPGILTSEKEEELKTISEKLAESLNLKALMDVEAIDTAKGLRILEIDARIPSQTPAAVLAATGVNILKEWVEPTSGGTCTRGASSYEHFVIRYGKMMTCGEKEFAKVRNPKIVRGLFGSDEMITDYESGANIWRCTMINGAGSEEALEKKRERCIDSIMSECGLISFEDPSPGVL
ncbi:MAG: 3-methylornithine--L-lysine ligase PylC [Methanomassiliicoccaceae archaeon]|jgi:pyrrolysine biosynthesis protein PylC|nr:3-methylornithine--L-lysine ligase PylC [Methanomassiliicoccaceae archaeon]